MADAAVTAAAAAVALHPQLSRLQQLHHPLDNWQAVKQHGSRSFPGPWMRVI